MAKYTKTAWYAGRLITRNDMEKIEDQFEIITPGATNVAENYKSSETYSKGDYCLYDGELWKCIATPIGTDEERKPKDNSAYWTKTKIMNETNSGISQSIANEYKENQNYEIGDYVTYNTDLYRCIETTHGAWNSQKWELVILSNDITNLISVQNQQPDNDVNKIWIKKTGDSEVTLLTKDDIEENYCKTDTIAPTFSTSTAYAAGDYVYYDGALYRFTTDHAIGAWTGDDAVEVKLSGEVGELKNAIENVYNNKKTIFYTLNPGFIGGTGAITGPGATTQEVYTDKIPVESGEKFNLKWTWGSSNSQWVAVATYDASQQFEARTALYSSTGASYATEYTVPSGVKYIVLTYRTYGAANLSITEDMVFDPDAIADNSISGTKLEDGGIDQVKLSFADGVFPVNLFNYQSIGMCKPGYWYYSTSVGSVVSATSNSSTTHYVAVKVPVYDSTKITLGIYPNDLSKLVYWVGAADADMKLIAYSITNQNAPVTYALPSGTVYFLASYNLGSANFATYLPKVMAVNGDSITSYSPYFEPYYLLEGCKTSDYSEVAQIQTIVGDNENGIKLEMPDNYDLVVGDTFQLFYKGIISAVRPEMFDVIIQCTKGMAFTRYFEITPTIAETLTMNIKLYGINHNLLDEKNVTLTVHAKASSPSSPKNVLCVGDSLTAGGNWPAEFYRRLTGTGGTPAGDQLTNISFIGTRAAQGAGYEAYGGWTWNSFNTENITNTTKEITCSHDKTEAEDQHSIYTASNSSKWKLETIESGKIKIICVSGAANTFPSSGTLVWSSGGTNHNDIVYTASTNAPGNPFWDSTEQKVDFASYATSQGVSSIDFVYVLLGWNCVQQSKTTIKEQAQTFIDNVQDSFPNAKIVLIGMEIPARDGLALNYGATGLYSKYYDLMNYVFDIDALYEELAGENTNVSHLSIAGQFDTEYNMLTGIRQVNTRNSETVAYQTNGIHPAQPGYEQIADAAYRDISKRL